MTPVAPAPLPVQPAPLEEDLVRQWERFAYAIAHDFFLPGADVEDLKQEALVGLLGGLRAHEPNRGPLKAFLGLAIRRHMITAVKFARARKHLVLTESARRGVSDEGEELEILDTLSDPQADPHERFLLRMRLAAIVSGLDSLTDLERRWLLASIHEEGWSHTDGQTNKSADNAVQRARRKLREAA